MKAPTVLCVVLMWFAAHASVAADLSASDFNQDGDDYISAAEYYQFKRYQEAKSPVFFDANRDGVLDQGEADALNAHLRTVDAAVRAAYPEDEFNDDYPQGMPLERFVVSNQTTEIGRYRKPLTLGKFLLRDSYEQPALDDSYKSVAKAKGASLQFNRDVSDGASVLTAKGALMRPISLSDAAAVTPSLEFNRLRNRKDRSKDIDVLNFRVAYERVFGLTTQHYLRFRPVYGTDSDFDSQVPALELQYQPVNPFLAMGVSRRLGKGIELRWAPLLHYEYGNVRDAGDNARLVSGQEFSRIGPKVNVELWHDSLERLGLGFGYEYLHDIGSDMRARKLFRTKLAYALDASGNLTFETEYVNGDTSLALEDQEQVTVGFGLKF